MKYFFNGSKHCVGGEVANPDEVRHIDSGRVQQTAGTDVSVPRALFPVQFFEGNKSSCPADSVFSFFSFYGFTSESLCLPEQTNYCL